MNAFVQKLGDVVKGTLTGFDRIVFKGSILPLMHDAGVRDFCGARGVLNKDYKSWMMAQTAQILDAAARFCETHGGGRVEPLRSSSVRKEQLVRARQRERGIDSGLIGVWSAVEPCRTYKARFCGKSGFPQLRGEWGKCKHLYFYFDHEDFGFMHLRLQTWLPYQIQICLNGREWLRRSLEGAGCGFVARGNKMLHVDDYALAQQLLDGQLDTRWDTVLDAFVPQVFPAMSAILGKRLGYYWTLWQSEWATDLVFAAPGQLEGCMDSLLRHAFMSGTSTRVLRYLDRPLTKSGQPDARGNQQVSSRLLDFAEGLRVRHWVDKNSVKIYNERNVLRVETTMNQPGMFKVHRRAQGEPRSAPKRRLSLRKGVADIPLRAKVSQEVNDRFMEQLATSNGEKPVGELFEDICRARKKAGRRIRALEPAGKDRALLQAISDPAFCIGGITNKALREKLAGKPGYNGRTEKQRSAKLSRQLRLLRDHGLIRKLPRQNKYQLTQKGRELTTSWSATLAASTQQLMDMAA